MAGSETPVASRRQFLGRLTALMAAAIGAALAVPAIGYLIGPSLRRFDRPPAGAGSVATLPPDQPVQREVVVETRDGWMTKQTTRAVWVVRRAGGEVVVYNPHCTHLGCAYRWNVGTRHFECPCHGGVYDLDGRVVAGPPPRPLDRLDVRVEGDELAVRYVDFQSGASKAVPL